MIKSPCVEKCQLDESGKYCLGCLRTIDEITQWSNFSETTKQKIIEKLNKK